MKRNKAYEEMLILLKDYEKWNKYFNRKLMMTLFLTIKVIKELVMINQGKWFPTNLNLRHNLSAASQSRLESR